MIFGKDRSAPLAFDSFSPFGLTQAGEHRWTLAEPAAAFQSHFFAADTREVMNAADFSTAVSASGTKSAWNTCHMPS